MVAPRKYPEELRERSIRLALDARKSPASRAGACRRIGEQLGINPETLRGWVTQAEVDAGTRTGTTTADAARLAELEREVRELRRANAILRSASAWMRADSTTTVGCWSSDPYGDRRRPKRLRGPAAASDKILWRGDASLADVDSLGALSPAVLSRSARSGAVTVTSSCASSRRFGQRACGRHPAPGRGVS